MAGKSLVFRFADVEVREREFSLTKAGEVLPVEPKAFRVLLILLHNPQKLIPKDELLTDIDLGAGLRRGPGVLFGRRSMVPAPAEAICGIAVHNPDAKRKFRIIRQI